MAESAHYLGCFPIAESVCAVPLCQRDGIGAFVMILDGEIIRIDLCLNCAKTARVWVEKPGKTNWSKLVRAA